MPADAELTPTSASGGIAVVGGGITGLAAAHRLVELNPGRPVTLFESAGRVGGVLQTVERDGFLVERSADNFLTKTPFATRLCERVGIGDELLPTNADRRRALIVHDGCVRRTPEGFVIAAPKRLWPLMTTNLLSVAGKLRLACEPLVPRRRSPADESVAAFVRRRLGSQALDRLVQPLVGGIYTGDVERLSIHATLPQFVEQEREHGSLWRAARQTPEATSATESGARYGAFVAPRGGMQQLVDAIEQHLPADALRKQVEVIGLERLGNGWLLSGPNNQPLGRFAGVVLATPAQVTARLLKPVDATLAAEVSGIEHASSVVACLAYRVDQFPTLPDGFGFVVPAREHRRVLAGSFSSLKFPGRAPEGKLLVRVFIGGVLQSELTTLDDNAITRLASEELAELVGTRGEPRVLDVVRWQQAMPQYHVGHLDRVAAIENLTQRHPGLALAGAAYRGVGVPQCIHSGEAAAERLNRLPS